MFLASIRCIALFAASLGCVPQWSHAAEDRAQPSPQSSPAAAGERGEPDIDVRKLFAAQCAWCHADYGMKAGKAPQLAGTRLTEKQVYNTIRNGRADAMPSFRRTLTEEQLQAFVKYIKGLPVAQ